MVYVHRLIEKHLLKLLRQFPALALTGPRQSGKSTLLRQVLSDRYQYLTFDDPLTRDRAASDPRMFLENASPKVIIDEIQYVPELLSYVKILIDENRSLRGRFVFTGSQQFTMIKNLGDSLAGRIALLELLPFHTEEKRMIRGLSKPLADPLGAFVHACLPGSHPEICTVRGLDPDTWYGSYLQTYLERDVRTIYNIGDLRDFQRFIQILASRVGQLLNMSSLSRELGVSVNTVKQWISILEAGRIIYLLPPYYPNLGKRITKMHKLYFLDCGLVCYLTGIRDKNHLLNGPLAGPLFENYCIQETVKSLFFKGDRRPRLYYVRTHNELEVDLLIEKGYLQTFACEIKLTKTPSLAMAKPLQRFAELFPKIKILDALLLSLAREETLLTRNVRLQPLDHYFRWLSEKA